MVSEYWERRREREQKEKMEEFNREKALKKKAEIEFKLNTESINNASRGEINEN